MATKPEASPVLEFRDTSTCRTHLEAPPSKEFSLSPPLDLVPYRAGLLQRGWRQTQAPVFLTCELAQGPAGPGRDGDPGPRAGKEGGSARGPAPSTRAAARIFPTSTHVARPPAPVGPVAPIWWLQTPHGPRRVVELPDPGTAPPRSMLSANRLESFSGTLASGVWRRAA